MADLEWLNLDAVPPERVAFYGLDKLPTSRPTESTTSLLRLDGRCALVTGGGGTGLGNATGHRLAEQGAAIAVLDISEDAARVAADEIAGKWGVKTIAVQADVGAWSSVEDAVRAAEAELGSIDILVNNVGGSGGLSTDGRRAYSRDDLVDLDVDILQLVVQVNLVSVMLVTKAVLPGMLQRGGGRIVNVASEAGISPQRGSMVYGSAKAGVIFFTKSLAVEFGRRGISPVAVCPGLFVLKQHLEMMADPTNPLTSIESGMSRTSIGRVGVADEIASMIAFLASPAGSYVHGTAVSVGGGISS